MSRKKVEWKLSIDMVLAARIESRMINQVTKKPTYGLRSKLIEALLLRYLSENPEAATLEEAVLEDELRETLERLEAQNVVT